MAPALSALAQSDGSSMLASSSIFSPSIVMAGVLRNRLSRSRSTSVCRCLKPYSARMMGDGSAMTTPASPSMMSQSSCSMIWLAARAPTTAGMSMLRATIAVCDVLPPTSVTKPANALCLNWSMSAGDRSCATRIRGTSMVSSSNSPCGALRLGDGGNATGDVMPRIARSTRSTICSRSALRSRR